MGSCFPRTDRRITFATMTDSPEPEPKWLRASIVVAALAAIGWLAAFAMGRVQIGVPGEWIWNPHTLLTVADIAIPICVSVIVMAAYLWFVTVMARGLDKARWRSWVAVPLVGLLSFFCLWSLQSCAPSPHRSLKPMWVLYHWGASGYFVDAQQLDDVSSYLDGFEAEMRKGEVLHKGTHPPGLVMLNYGLLKFCRQNPGLADAVRTTMPSTVRDEFERRVPKLSLSNTDRAALWLSVLLTQFAAAMTVVPLYGLMRRELNTRTSLLLASLWPLVPGVAIFLPKSDAVYPVFAATFLWFVLAAWDKGSLVRAAAAGVTFWCGMMLSLAMLPIAVIAALHTLLRIKTERPTVAGACRAIGGVLGTFAAATAGFYMATGVRLWQTWFLNFQNHAGFYAQFERTYGKWLAANPLELLLTIGAPVLIVAVLAIVSAVRHRSLHRFVTPIAVLATWVLLWLSGKNMGEGARLWVLLTPALLWAVAATFARIREEKQLSVWWTLAISQAVVAITSVAIVNGFSAPL